MQIAIKLDPMRLRRWHLWLLDALSTHGFPAAQVLFAPSPAPRLPAGVELLLRLERKTGRVAALNALDHMPASDPAFARSSHSGTPPRLIIDLSGTASLAEATTLVPLFDGSADERALWAALLAGRAPAISVGGGALRQPVDMALPAVESPSNLHSAAATSFARVVEALAIAARDITAGRDLVPRMNTTLPLSARRSGTALGFATGLIATKLQRMLDRRFGAEPVWSVAYRAAPSGRTHPPSPLLADAFSRLPDDGLRYYADPFLFRHGDRLHLFVEEFPFATERGIISLSTLDADGHFTTPRAVLERPYHLSYPQVFERDGEIWMMPEASASGAIELYRADRFPDRFVLHARLVEGAFHDATLFEHDNRLWIAAGSQCQGSSTWDALSLFHADHLEGSWTPHARNPVVVDARCARPAGELYRQDGALWRPSQDCSGGYGSALTLARVDRLTPDEFAETPIATLRLGDARGLSGPHTCNHTAGYEVIDAFAPRRWKPGG